MSIQLFEQKLQELETCFSEANNLRSDIQLMFENDIQKLWKRVFPKRKFNRSKACDELWDFSTIFDKYMEVYESEEKIIEDRKKILNKELDTLAQNLQAPITDTYLVFDTIQESSYRSQGMGASRYARGNAELNAEHAIMYGVDAKVEPFDNLLTYENKSFHQKGYNVLAKTTKAGWDIVNRKKTLTIKDYVESCRKKGINPRVMMPWLPYDLGV